MRRGEGDQRKELRKWLCNKFVSSAFKDFSETATKFTVLRIVQRMYKGWGRRAGQLEGHPRIVPTVLLDLF